MARRRLDSWGVLSLALGGFVACTFGAGDFEIVPDDAPGGSGATNVGGSQGNVGGDGDGGGAESDGGSDGTSGAGLGGEPPAGGAGGAPNGPRFLCTPLAQTLEVFTPADLENRPIQGDPFVVAVQDSVIVGVTTSPAMAGSMESKLFVRPVSDSGGGSLHTIGGYTINSSRFQVAEVAPDGANFRLLGVSDFGIFDLTYTTADGGRTLQNTSIVGLPMHEACDNTSGAVDGYLRDVEGFYDGDWTYAASCGRNDSGGMPETFSLWVKLPENASALAIPGPAPQPIDNIVREFVKVGDTYFMLVGNEVGESIGVRMGTSLQQLQAVHQMALSDDPLIFTSLMIRPIQDTLFVHGVSFTTDGSMSPPLVPARIYDGSVGEADLPDLLVQTDGSNAPPSPLQHTATFTKASELVGTDDAIPFGPNNVLLAGASVAPRDSVNIAVVTRDGVVLAPPTQVYTSANGTTIDDHSLKVAHLGIGFLAVWIEDGTVKARSVSCLQD